MRPAADAASREDPDDSDLALTESHGIASAHRVWDEPFVLDEETFDLGGPVSRDDVRAAVTQGYESRERRNGGRAARSPAPAPPNPDASRCGTP